VNDFCPKKYVCLILHKKKWTNFGRFQLVSTKCVFVPQWDLQLRLYFSSGLDSVTSRTLLLLLRDLARQGRTVVCTVHQPSAALFMMFDQLHLLTAGRCAYRGTTANVVSYLERLGLRCPPYHNPADFGKTSLILRPFLRLTQNSPKVFGVKFSLREIEKKSIIMRNFKLWKMLK